MIITLVATPSDTVPSSRMIYGGLVVTIVFDFTAVLNAGDTISTATWVFSNSGIAQASVSHTSTTASVVTQAVSLLDGERCSVSCIVVTAAGDQQGRSLRFVAYDTGTVGGSGALVVG